MRRAAAIRCSLPDLWPDSRFRADGSWPRTRGLAIESNRSAGCGWDIGDEHFTFDFREFGTASHAGSVGWDQAMGANRCTGVRRNGDIDLDLFVDLSGDQVEMGERIEQEEEWFIVRSVVQR